MKERNQRKRRRNLHVCDVGDDNDECCAYAYVMHGMSGVYTESRKRKRSILMSMMNQWRMKENQLKVYGKCAEDIAEELEVMEVFSIEHLEYKSAMLESRKTDECKGECTVDSQVVEECIVVADKGTFDSRKETGEHEE